MSKGNIMKKIMFIGLIILLVTSLATINGLGQNNSNTKQQPIMYPCPCEQTDFYDTSTGINYYQIMQNPLQISKDFIPSETIHITIAETPSYFNWRNYENHDWTTPAKHQKNCGSCWDFAALGSFESAIKIREGCCKLNPDLSEQYVLSCLPAAANTYGRGCWGGNPSAALYYLMNTTEEGNFYNGAIFETCFPYEASDQISCEEKCPNWQNYLVPLSNTSELWLGLDSQENREIIKTTIMDFGPVAAGMNVSDAFIQFWQLHHKDTDYFPDPHMPWGNSLNHIIVIIGWNDDPSLTNGGYWICKNSWGSDWGYGGYFNIEYGALFTGFLITWAEYDPQSFDWPPVALPGQFYNAAVNEELQFDGSGSVDAEGPITNYEWNFGDGTTQTGSMVSHSFDTPGIYLVNLTVTDAENQTGSAMTIVGVDTMPFDITISGGIGFEISILNQLDVQINDLEWKVVSTGLVWLQKTSGYIYQISVNQEKSLSLLCFGIGFGKIEFDFHGIVIEKSFLIFGPFVKTLNI